MFDIPSADAYVISDVLHYIDHDAQKGVIQQCFDKLNPGGVLVIRDGDASLKERHALTEQSERWSTKIMKFNKTDGPLCFLSKGQIWKLPNKMPCLFRLSKAIGKPATLCLFSQKSAFSFMDNKFDIVIIGSGLGAWSAA